MHVPIAVALPAAVVLAVVLTSCAGGPPPAAPASAAPTTAVAPTSSPAPTTGPTTVAPAAARACNIEITMDEDSNSVSGDGPGSMSVRSTPDGALLTCDGGPELTLRVASGAVTVTVDGMRARIRSGASAQVGSYRVEVVSARGGTAQVRVLPR